MLLEACSAAWRTPSGRRSSTRTAATSWTCSRRSFSVGELVDRLGLTQPQTSKRLKVLREAGLVRVEQRAQRRIYAIEAQAPMAELDTWLAPYRRLWNDSLDRLGAHLDKETR